MSLIPLFSLLLMFFMLLSVVIIAGRNAIREARLERVKRVLKRENVPEARRILKKLWPLKSQAEEKRLREILKEAGHSDLLAFFQAQFRSKMDRTSLHSGGQRWFSKDSMRKG